MTDPDLVAKKLALIETCIADLRRLARVDALADDVREERFVEHTLQIAIQAAIDVASHLVSDLRLGEPRTNRELFDLLERGGIAVRARSRVARASSERTAARTRAWGHADKASTASVTWPPP
jgi:uncharacterized protein YutE (UPF0331/DUF86 family)